jgi:hypothetical protein
VWSIFERKFDLCKRVINHFFPKSPTYLEHVAIIEEICVKQKPRNLRNCFYQSKQKRKEVSVLRSLRFFVSKGKDFALKSAFVFCLRFLFCETLGK